MTTRDPNAAMVARVAQALGDLRARVVFLGGAATGLLLTDPGAAPIRSTKDVDVIVEVGGIRAYRELEKTMQGLGFHPDQSEGAPLCRWRMSDLSIDVMPTDPKLLGFSNRWYPLAMAQATWHPLPDGTTIRLVTAPCFLATKLEAFRGRGKGDFLSSHDLEDVVSVLDGRVEVVEEIASSDPDLRCYLAETFKSFLKDQRFLAAVQGHLPPDRASQARYPALLERIRVLSDSVLD